MKKHIIVLILNIILFTLELVSLLWLVFQWDVSSKIVLSDRVYLFKYFTNDSNILVLFSSFIVIIDLIIAIIKKREDITFFSYIASLVSCVGVVLTCVVIVFFLAPLSGADWYYSFARYQLFLHLINPIFSTIVFVFFMKTTRIKLGQTLIGIVPMFIYSIYYCSEAFTHIVNGKINRHYDWYSFMSFGIGWGMLIMVLIYAITFGICVGLWKLNRIKAKDICRE